MAWDVSGATMTSSVRRKIYRRFEALQLRIPDGIHDSFAMQQTDSGAIS
jgi:hypothetical protein